MLLKTLFTKPEIKDEWIFYSRKTGISKNFYKFNYAFISAGVIKNKPYLLEISIFLTIDLEKNYTFLYELEDKLSEKLEEEFESVFIATKKTESKYIIYFYIEKDSSEIQESIATTIFNLGEFDFSIAIEKDKKWKKYFLKLAPSLIEYEYYKNELKFYELEKDCFGKEKIFNYFISYKKESYFYYLKKSLEGSGFIIESKGEGKRKNFSQAIKVSKKHLFSLQDINKDVEILLKLSKQYHCIYEGWLIEDIKKKK